MAFITGFLAGCGAMYFVLEYYRIRNWMVKDMHSATNNEENTRWRNLMAYDGSERGQVNYEN